jgi:CYTH domain-containing protein
MIMQSKLFQKPDWFGVDITEDKRFKNKYLATYSRNDEKYKILCKEYNISL